MRENASADDRVPRNVEIMQTFRALIIALFYNDIICYTSKTNKLIQDEFE